PDRATPMLDSRINRVTLNPSWTIPPTILKEDKLPQIRSNPAYFSERNMQVLDHQGNQLDPAQIDWHNPRGILLRQPPGPDNPLGRMVFRFDNPFAVYLHDTPSQSLFARAVRNVSSGCVRVEQASELADYLFYTLDQQQRERIEQRMTSGRTHEIAVRNGPQVLLTYWTAEALEDGSLRFSPDPSHKHEPLAQEYHRAIAQQRGLQPAPAAEVHQQAEHDHQHQQHDRRVAPGPAQLRHDIEVHAVDPGDEGQRHEQRGKDGQHLHDLVGALADIGQVQVQQAAEQLAQRPDGFAQQQHLALVVVDLRQGVRSGTGDDLVFQFLHPLAQVFEHFEVMVHHRVQQCIGQIVAAHEADAAPRAQAFAH